MKHTLLLILICLAIPEVNAQNATSVNNGNWLNPLTWDCMCIPLPGYFITINHTISMDTDFAYSSGEIVINSGGSLIQNITNRNLWVSGTGYLGNYGIMQIKNILYEGNNGSLMNSGTITAVNLHLTTGLDNIGNIEADSLYNNNFMNNYGIIETTAITNTDLFINSGNLEFTNFTNTGIFQNAGGIAKGTNNVWNQGKIVNYSFSEITIDNNLLNSNLLNFDALIENEALMFIGNSLYNYDTIRGIAGYVEVGDTSYNSGFMLGTFDFCDLTPPASAPFVDINAGTISAGITWCQQQDVAKSTKIDIVVFPNPAEDILYFTMPFKNDYEIRIFDNAGREILRKTGTGSYGVVEISGLVSGIYTFLMNIENEIRSVVFMKQ